MPRLSRSLRRAVAASTVPALPAVLRSASAGAPLAALLALLLVTAVGCGGGEEAPAGPGAQQPQAVPVEVAEARRDGLSVRITAVGSLEADNLVEVRPETSGTVAAIPVEEGETVSRGAVLVRLDGRELAAELAAADAAVERNRTELENLQTRLERNRGLFEKGAISRQTLDDLESSQKAAAARLEEARAQRDLAARRLEKTVLRAPFDGRAGARSFYPGDFVQEGQSLFPLVDDDPLKVEFSVPEQYVGRLHEGNPVDLQVRSLPGESFEGRVVFIGPRIDPASRTASLKAEVPNPEGRLRPGQFADVQLELERREGALLVPEAAIVPRGGENFLYVVDPQGNAVERRVELGQRERGRVEVRSGVEAGEQVVVAGQQRLRDGSPVRLVPGGGGGDGAVGDATADTEDEPAPGGEG